MADNSSATVPPANGSAQQQRPSFTRGRGRGRGRGNFQNAQRARNDINRDGAPVQLDSKFLGFTEKKHGNAVVTINHGVSEIIGNDLREVISVNQASKGFFDINGQPMDLDYLSRGTTGGLCLSFALKMIQATPNSQLPMLGAFSGFEKFQIFVPRNVVQILDLVGKTDYQDWVIRIGNNTLTIRRLLLKSMKYFKLNVDFVNEYVHLTGNALTAFNTLDALAMTAFDNIYFSDKDSVKDIKKRALDWLEVQLATNFPITINNNPVQFSYPQLPAQRNQANILAWLGMFVNNIHPNFTNIIATGVLLLMEESWLVNPLATMQAIDNNYAGTPVATLTPIALMNACGIHHYTEYLSEAHFIQLARSCYTYYETTITGRLKSIFWMITQLSSGTGSPAQLVLTPDDIKVNRTNNGMARNDIDPNLNHCISYVKLDTGHSVVKSAMCNLVKEVDLDPDYEGHIKEGTLYSIRRGFFNLDGMVYSQQRMYN